MDGSSDGNDEEDPQGNDAGGNQRADRDPAGGRAAASVSNNPDESVHSVG